MIRRPPRSPLFPSTTLSRSCGKIGFTVESDTPYPYQFCFCSICRKCTGGAFGCNIMARRDTLTVTRGARSMKRSEEHTSELQSQSNLVCRLLLEKKKNKEAELFTRTISIVISLSMTPYNVDRVIKALNDVVTTDSRSLTINLDIVDDSSENLQIR